MEKIVNENESDYINWSYNDEFIITFRWDRTPKINDEDEIIYVKDNDPFYFHVYSVNGLLIYPCAFCNDDPQLRYNKIIDKWYVNCSAEALCTENNDGDELKTLIENRIYDEEHGFFENPVKAILNWNINQLENELVKNKNILKEIK